MKKIKRVRMRISKMLNISHLERREKIIFGKNVNVT